MNTQQQATPAQNAATPQVASNEQNGATPSAQQTPATNKGGSGNESDGKVTISTKEYARLQRAEARSLSFEKRKEFNARNPQRNPQGNGAGSSEPDNEEIQRLQQENEVTAKELHKERVTNRVRAILDKPEYAALPKSTRELIIKNPAMLSSADNVEEALLDIEDFVLEQISGLETAQPAAGAETKDPAGHETPGKVSSGGPDLSAAAGMEDLSKLKGSARSRAALRNAIKAKKGVTEVK